MARIAWTHEAENDLRRLMGRIARDSGSVSKKWTHRLRRSVNVLKRHPEIGSPVDDVSRIGYRELIEGNYRILYRFDGNTCLIAGVVRADGRRGPLH